MDVKARLKSVGEMVQEYALTALALVFMISGTATFLILFNWVDAGEQWKHIFGAINFAYAVIAFVVITNRGVKHTSKSKKGKK